MSLVSPVIVQEVEAHCCDTVPPVAAVTVYPVIGAPLSAPASKFSSTNPSPISPMRGAEGGAGLPRTTIRISPVTWRSGSPVSSSTVY